VHGEPARHLHPIDTRTGEVGTPSFPGCAECQRKADEIACMRRDLRGWAIRYKELERDKAAEARESPLWPVGELLFHAWRVRCNHPRSPWCPDRFWDIEPFLSTPRYGKTLEVRVMLCARAIAGAGFDAFERKRKNGTTKRFDDWSKHVFKDTATFEECANRAPRGWSPTIGEPLRLAVATAEAQLKRIREAARS
jgi:hypothetical protein